MSEPLRACVKCGEEKPESGYLRPRRMKGGPARPWNACAACMRVALSKGGKMHHQLRFAHIGGSRVREDGSVFCTTCEQWKPREEFGNSPGGRSGIRGDCKACADNAAQTRHAKRLASGMCTHCGKRPLVKGSVCFCERCRDLLAHATKKRKTERKARAIALLGGKCVDCGFITNRVVAYDFHHLPGMPKTAEISNLLRRCTWKRLEKELQSCVLLCSNCHRIRHDDDFWREEPYE